MIVYFIFLSLIFVWIVLLLSVPYLMSIHKLPNELIFGYYSVFKLICHQQPDRSYFIMGNQIPVCVRCLGIYTGLLLGTLVYPIFNKLNNTKIPHFKYLIIAFVPILIDGFSQILNLYPSIHYIRFLTGLLASSVLVFYMIPVQNLIFKRLKM